MEAKNTLNNTSGVARHYILSLLGLAFMMFFRFVPPPEPVTSAGMAVLGDLIGFIILISAVDYLWPAFAVIGFYAFDAFKIHPDSVQDAGIYEAAASSWGNWITLFLVSMLLICTAMEKTGLMRRIALFFVTRKFAKKGAWPFTIMLFLAILVVSSVLDPVPACLTMIMCSHEIIKTLGFQKGDAWPKMVITSIPIIAGIGFAMSPIGHNLPIAILTMVAEATNTQINIAKYLVIGIPIGLVLFIAMILFFRYISKPDVSKFSRVDFSDIDNMRPGKMNKREKIVAIVAVIVLMLWLIPGFAALVVPDSSFINLLNELTLLWPPVMAAAFLGFVKLDGEPLLDIKAACKDLDWTSVIMFASVIMIALTVNEDTTGIPQWLAENVAPMIGGFGAFAAVAFFGLLAVFLTNLMGNWAVAVVLSSVALAVSTTTGIAPGVFAVAIAIGSNLAFTTPAAQVIISFSMSDEYSEGGYVFKTGVAMMIISMIVMGLLMYPLGMLVY